MFSTNKYTKWYYEIINNAKNTIRVGYTENHHIIPSALGGPNDNTNKVKLTAREHFIVHKLLTKMTSGKNKQRMQFAYLCFFRKNSYHIERLEVFSSREYERRKRIMSETTSALHKGKKVSSESVQKMLSSRLKNNKPYPDTARLIHSENAKKLWANNYEKMLSCHQSQSTRNKISKAHKGKKLSPKVIQEISARTKGANNPRAKNILVTSPEGTTYKCHGNFQLFCKKHQLPFSSMCHILHKTRSFKNGATVGWSAEFI